MSTWIFHDENYLRINQITEFLQSKAAVSAGERGYRYMCDWVSQNASRLKEGNDTGDTFGVIDGDYAYIIRSVFQKAVDEAGFSSAALLSYLKQSGLILTRGRRNTRGKRINGVLTECVTMRIGMDENEEDQLDFEEI